MTPHIEAQKGDFAKTVLFPGDPLRAKYIADNFLTNAKQITGVRGMLGFTGEYKGVRLSTMGSGMGIPSCSIYAKELYSDYEVQNIIRVGSAGAISDNVKVRDVIIAISASTDSSVNRSRFDGYDFAATADFKLAMQAYEESKVSKADVHVGTIFSSDLFYHPKPQLFELMKKYGILGVEMEAAGLYGVAAECGGRALTIATVSDHIFTGESLPASERQSSLNDMIHIALETSVNFKD